MHSLEIVPPIALAYSTFRLARILTCVFFLACLPVKRVILFAACYAVAISHGLPLARGGAVVVEYLLKQSDEKPGPQPEGLSLPGGGFAKLT